MTGKAGLPSGTPVGVSMETNSTAPSAEEATTPIRSSMPAKRQYCTERRKGRPATSSITAPSSRVQHGVKAGSAGSAIQRARGTAAADSMPSRTTLTAIRISERAAAMAPL